MTAESAVGLAAGNVTTSLAAASRTYEPEQLVRITIPLLLLAMVPLAFIAAVSWIAGLGLSTPISTSTVRTFVQLSVLGFILDPIFAWGTDYWPIVLCYLLFMTTLGCREAARRTKYVFAGMGPTLLLAMFLNVSAVGAWAFGLVIRPTPYWNPQYVIPIVGMLLGNGINGLSLSLNSLLVALVENQREIELYLSFGATGFEASGRLVREAIMCGVTPTLNSMAVIGLVSIPGMMTGQILGGASVVDAARYQMIIMYLIATCTFGSVLAVLSVVVRVAFDGTHMLRVDRFVKREKGAGPADLLRTAKRLVLRCFGNGASVGTGAAAGRGEMDALASTSEAGLAEYGSGGGGGGGGGRSIEVLTLGLGRRGNEGGPPALSTRGIVRSVSESDLGGAVDAPHRVLFSDLSFEIGTGEIAAVRGPSGSGKSQLLRALAGLSPSDGGEIRLGGGAATGGEVLRPGTDWTSWRRRVRYVTQLKVDVPGTPRDLATTIASFRAYRTQADAPSLEDMIGAASEWMERWNLSRTCIDREWSYLSGGEAQRIILAFSLASGPSVVLLDESTSALDMESKLRVEEGMKDFAAREGAGILLTPHDEDQIGRLRGR